MSKYPIGSLNLEKIQDTLYDWVNSICQGVLGKEVDGDVSIIWRNQSEPLPPRPCVTLKFIAGPSPTDRQANQFLNPGGQNFGYGMQQEATLSIQVFGNTNIHKPLASQLALDLNSSLMVQEVLDDLKRGGVAIQGVGHPTNLTALEESEYEERAGFELALGLVQNITSQPSTIETVNLNMTVDGQTTVKQIVIP